MTPPVWGITTKGHVFTKKAQCGQDLEVNHFMHKPCVTVCFRTKMPPFGAKKPVNKVCTKLE